MIAIPRQLNFAWRHQSNGAVSGLSLSSATTGFTGASQSARRTPRVRERLGVTANKTERLIAYGFAIAIALGILIALHAIWSIVAYLLSSRSKASTRSLTIYNISLSVMITLTLLAGSYIWYCSLRQSENYAMVYQDLSSAIQTAIQERLQCCGYYNATVAGIFTSVTGYCSSAVVSSNLFLTTFLVLTRPMPRLTARCEQFSRMCDFLGSIFSESCSSYKVPRTVL